MRSLRRLTIGIIGGGNMGQALIRGLAAARVPSSRMLVVEINPALRRAIVRRHRVRAGTLERAASSCHVIILAVKPQDLRPVLEALRAPLRKARRRVVVISIAAGVTVSAIERALGRQSVIRVMPNLPAKIGAGMSAVTRGRFATSSDAATARAIFACVGEVVELPERSFDIVTAISGSGPAYFFVIFRALRDAGVAHGLPKDVAAKLAVRTALGSAKLVDGAADDLDRLITQVASKKGTTEAALKVFARKRLAEILKAGVSAAARRSKELSHVHAQ